MKSAALRASPSDSGVGSADFLARVAGARAAFLLAAVDPAGRARVLSPARGVRVGRVLLDFTRMAAGLLRGPVLLAVLVRLVVLLAVFAQPVLSVGAGRVRLERSAAALVTRGAEGLMPALAADPRGGRAARFVSRNRLGRQLVLELLLNGLVREISMHAFGVLLLAPFLPATTCHAFTSTTGVER